MKRVKILPPFLQLKTRYGTKNQAKGSKQRACNYCAFKPTHLSLKVCQFSIKVNRHFHKVIVNKI